MRSTLGSLASRRPSWPYVAPFALYLGLMTASPFLPLEAGTLYPVRVVLVAAALLWWSRNLIRLNASRWGASILLGVAVFVIWIGPDLLWPSYRSHWLFQNQLTGTVASSTPAAEQARIAFLLWRVLGSAVLVPIIEELFWRAWLMRYLISRDFLKVPLGAYAAQAFWISAVLFACEHGPYWDVGLAAGVLYNWWLVRSRNLADCIVAHATTNACLAVHVLSASQWQYWP